MAKLTPEVDDLYAAAMSGGASSSEAQANLACALAALGFFYGYTLEETLQTVTRAWTEEAEQQARTTAQRVG